jgi:hypothetical protein
MPLDAAKMKSYLSTTEPRPGRKLPVAQPAAPKGKASIDVAAFKAALLCGDDVDDAAVQRLASKEVGYVELAGMAGGFSCGTCRSYASGECQNEKVQACVSDEHGCCNLWWATEADAGEITFPPISG